MAAGLSHVALFAAPLHLAAGSLRLRAARYFCAHSSRDNHGDHFLVGEPGPQRMAECGGLVVLDEKMREPGERIRNRERSQDHPGPAQDDGCNQDAPAGQSSDGVKDARQRLTVRQDVNGPEFSESSRFFHVCAIVPHASRIATIHLSKGQGDRCSASLSGCALYVAGDAARNERNNGLLRKLPSVTESAARRNEPP